MTHGPKLMLTPIFQLVVFLFVCMFVCFGHRSTFWWHELGLHLGATSAPPSPSSFSSIVEAGRLFSCQPPLPVSLPSPSPLLPSLPPARPPPSSMSSWRLTPVAARCRAPQVRPNQRFPIFTQFLMKDPNILIMGKFNANYLNVLFFNLFQIWTVQYFPPYWY